MKPPSEDVRRDLEHYLANDQSRVGEVYRLTHQGLDPHEIAEQPKVPTSGFVSNNRTKARALLEGRVPTGASIAREVLSFVRKAKITAWLTGDTVEYLDELETALVGVAEGSVEATARRASRRLPAASTPLRTKVEEEVRRRTKELVERIHAETDLRALDYRSVVASDRPLDAMVRVIRWRGDDGTFDDLLRLGRRDLTLEQAVVIWAEDLPLTFDLVDEAAARIDWTI